MTNREIKANLEAEVGHIVASEDIKHMLKEWMEDCGDDAEKMLLLWVSRETGTLHTFGSGLKCVEAIGYLETAKSDLLDYMFQGEEDD